MKDITINFSVDEINIVLNALSNRPYMEVYQLIEKIQSEGNKQLEESSEHDSFEEDTTN